MRILILAALAIASPAAAQTAPDPAQTTAEAAPVAPATSTDVATATPAGGYGPVTTNLAVPPGATVVYRQAPTPDQAYPAPAPLAKYPVCKKGQYDKCIQRGGR